MPKSVRIITMVLISNLFRVVAGIVNRFWYVFSVWWFLFLFRKFHNWPSRLPLRAHTFTTCGIIQFFALHLNSTWKYRLFLVIFYWKFSKSSRKWTFFVISYGKFIQLIAAKIVYSVNLNYGSLFYLEPAFRTRTFLLKVSRSPGGVMMIFPLGLNRATTYILPLNVKNKIDSVTLIVK